MSQSTPGVDLGRLAPGLGKTCGDYLVSYRAELEAAVRAGEGGVAVAERHARVLDGMLGALYCAADAASRAASRAPRGRVALVGVGGYGRGVLGLRSDIDLLFLAEHPDDPAVAALAEALLYPLWDLKLTIGHAVRGVADTLRLAREDVTTATTLLDARRIAGDSKLVQDLVKGGREKLFDVSLEAFVDSLEGDVMARRERFGGSLFLLEPEVKLGYGGLRDLDAMRWAAGARFGTCKLAELVVKGALLPREVKELDDAREMLWRVRNWLHLRAGRRQDRLTFEDQEEVARQLGYADGPTLGVEQFMHAYYRAARSVATLADRVIVRSRPPSRRGQGSVVDLGDGVIIFGSYLTLRNSEELATDPALALRLYRHVAHRGLPPYEFARDAIARVAGDPEWCERLRSSPESAPHFLALLSHAGDAPVARGSILGELHELGLLLAMVPEFGSVTGRVQHDVYHVYTVDVHSVRAVDRLRELARGDLAADLPLASRLAAETPGRVPLFVGLLLHDVGKAHGKDHARKGALMAGPIGTRLGLAPAEVAHVEWLVLEHLSLYHGATRRDTSDPETIAEVARSIQTPDRLRDLFLLTVADLSTTSPTAMTSWKARMLEDLYLAVGAALGAEDATATHAARADASRAEARARLAGEPGAAVLEQFLDSMPDRYLLANPIDVVLVHARAARDRGDLTVHLASRPGPSADVVELVVVTDDRPGLLADVAAVLSSNRFDVTAAQIYTRARPGRPEEAFDVFHACRVGRSVSCADPAALAKIGKDIDALLSGRTTTRALLAGRARPPSWAPKGPGVPTEVRVDNHVSRRFTVVDVYTRDMPGLLHTIARVLHEQGLTIALSKVNTEGNRVADVFYVTQPGGGKVDLARLGRLPIVLREAIARLQADRGGEDTGA